MSLPCTTDAFLGKRLWLQQPKIGYRIAIDPVFLAASLPLKPNLSVLDLGCGVGAVSCFLRAREPSLEITGVEKNKALLDLARANHQQSGGGSFHPLHTSLEDLNGSERFDHVVLNPPFYTNEAHTPSPYGLKVEANIEKTPLKIWVQKGLAHLKPQGILTAILPPQRLPEFLSYFSGGVRLFPLWPYENRPALRLIIQVFLDSKAPFYLGAGMVLHHADHTYTDEAQAILEGGSIRWTP